MFRSLGNLLVNPHVGLLFIDFEAAKRLRVNGALRCTSTIRCRRPTPGRSSIVRVRAARIFPNCPRYIHRMQMVEASVYVPRAGRHPGAGLEEERVVPRRPARQAED